jgi:hypothetical protein
MQRSAGPFQPGSVGAIVVGARDYLAREYRRALRFTTEMSAHEDMRDAQAAPPEVFTSMLIVDLLARRSLDPLVVDSLLATIRFHLKRDRIHFFARPELLPADIDCTSFGVSVLLEAGAIDAVDAQPAIDAVVGNVDARGYLMAYFQPAERDHVDPAVCTNALYLLHMVGRARDAQKTEELVHQFLVDDKHLSGTRYYQSPDTFLYFVARLCGRFPAARERFAEPLGKALDARVRATASPLDIAVRVLSRQRLGMQDAGEREALLPWVRADGSFPSYALYRAGKQATYFGCAALTTAFAAAALDRRNLALDEATPSTYYVGATS